MYNTSEINSFRLIDTSIFCVFVDIYYVQWNIMKATSSSVNCARDEDAAVTEHQYILKMKDHSLFTVILTLLH